MPSNRVPPDAETERDDARARAAAVKQDTLFHEAMERAIEQGKEKPPDRRGQYHGVRFPRS